MFFWSFSRVLTLVPSSIPISLSDYQLASGDGRFRDAGFKIESSVANQNMISMLLKESEFNSVFFSTIALHPNALPHCNNKLRLSSVQEKPTFLLSVQTKLSIHINSITSSSKQLHGMVFWGETFYIRFED